MADFTVAICTRNRPDQVRATLAALAAQTDPRFPLLVVDQSDEVDPEVAAVLARATGAHGATREHVVDPGRGLSRARNLAARTATSDWIVFLDDDCRPEPEWAERLRAALEERPEAGLVSGHVEAHDAPEGDYLPVAVFPVTRPALRRGRWLHPGHVGFGVCFAVRRSVVEALGGWDERLGPGAAEFPAADDMDFNFRFLRAGGVAYLTPAVRAAHDQWRSRRELVALHRGYLTAWAGFAMKHLRSGDRGGGLWLWVIGFVDVLDAAADAVTSRSSLRAALAVAKLRGLLRGTVRGLRRSW